MSCIVLYFPEREVKPVRVRSSDDSDAAIAKRRKTEGQDNYTLGHPLRRHNSESVFHKPFGLASGEWTW